MVSHKRLVIMILLLSAMVFAQHLAWIEVTPVQRIQFQELNISVYWSLANGFLAPLDEAQISLLLDNGFKLEILDAEIGPGEYFLCYRVGRGSNSCPGRLLWTNEHFYLTRMPEFEAINAKTLGYEMVRLPSTPHPIKIDEGAAGISYYDTPDTTIQRLVSEVSETNLEQSILDLQNFITRYSYAPTCDSAARYLYRRFDSLGLDVNYDLYMLNSDSSYNIEATYLGQVYPDSIIIACGHFDSYSNIPYTNAPGADDDASGVAAALEIARVLATAQFDCTIKYLAFSGEEQWMVGSSHWVDSVAVPQNLQIAGAYNLDMIGYTAYDTNLLYVTPNTPSIPLAVLAESMNVQYEIGLNLVNYLDEDAAGDQTPFWQNGYKAVFVIEDSEWGIWGGSNPYYHTPYDTLGNLRMSLVRKATQVALASIATMAGPVGASVSDANANQSPDVQGIIIAPNPMRNGCSIKYVWSGDGEEELIIYDAMGRVVRLLATNRNTGFWNGQDENGKKVPSGVYFIRCPKGEHKAMAKITVLE